LGCKYNGFPAFKKDFLQGKFCQKKATWKTG